MAKTRKVIVEGGDVFEVTEHNRWYYVRRVKIGLFGNSKTGVGKVASLDDAIALIRSHSGRQIRSIR